MDGEGSGLSVSPAPLVPTLVIRAGTVVGV